MTTPAFRCILARAPGQPRCNQPATLVEVLATAPHLSALGDQTWRAKVPLCDYCATEFVIEGSVIRLSMTQPTH